MKAIEKPQAIITTALFFLLALIALMLTMSGCVSERVVGNHDLITEDRTSETFKKVVASGSCSVYVIPSDETRVEVKGESNILPYLNTWSDGTTITIRFDDMISIKEHYPVEVYLYTPELNTIRLSGSGNVESGSFFSENVDLNISGSGGITADFDTENLDATISGSGNIYLSGFASNTDLRISGSGNIDAADLEQRNCFSGITGSGSVITQVTHSLNADITGSGSVFYLGNPQITSHISGSGKVARY